MKEANGNLWVFRGERAEWICITTNGFVKNNGHCVMGRGCAKEANEKFNISAEIGGLIKQYGNRVLVLHDIRIITFPVKHKWFEIADLSLIEKSAHQLIEVCDKFMIEKVYMPRPGCGNGKLDWNNVKPVLANILDDRFTVVTY